MRTSSANGNTADVDLTVDLSAPCAPDELFGWVDDLGRYPQWMGLVHAAVPADHEAGEASAKLFPVWNVEIRARIGPFSRSKRLTMARTVCEPSSNVVFERYETDGRKHSTWRLGARVVPVGSGSRLEMHLHYGGSLWTGGLMERALSDEINRSRDRLVRLIADSRL